MLFAGVNDFVFKKQAAKGNGCGQYMAVAGVVWFAVFTVFAMLSGGFQMSSVALRWGIFVGAVSASANYLLIRSLRDLDASVGATIYRLNLLAAAVIAVLFLNEALTVLKSGGILLATIAVVFFCEKHRRYNGRTDAFRGTWISDGKLLEPQVPREGQRKESVQ